MAYLLQQILEISANHYPDKEAVIYKNQSITYQNLDKVSNQLARVLNDAGIGKGDRVGVCLNKSIAAVATIYGILKSGAAYVPIDPLAPVKRLKFLITDCELKALVTTSTKLTNLYKDAADDVSQHLKCVILEDGGKIASEFSPAKVVTWEEMLRSPDTPLSPTGLIDQDLATIIYTSGSTGQPKGVMISHRALLTSVNCLYQGFDIQPTDRIAGLFSIYFIGSVFDIFLPIKAGATLVLVPPELAVLPVELSKFTVNQQITIWSSVSSLLTQLVLRGNIDQYQFPDLRIIIFGGEPFPQKYLHQLMQSIPQAKYYQLYGSTEAFPRTCYLIENISPDMTKIPIGKAFPNIDLFVMNDNNQIVQPGESGELCMRGSSLMKGYWKNPEKTKEVLIPYVINPHLGAEIVFRTGDIVQQDTNGNYIYIGRRDHQIKSRGYRIELGEIETTLYSHPDIEEAVVIAIPDEQINNRIEAVVVTKQGSNLQEHDLQYFCAERLPKYMIPEKIEFRLNSLPKTITGKIDRNLLRTEAIEKPTKVLNTVGQGK
ncbi:MULTISPECIES: amino acid adenylation domain-containing protein [unclassified Anabaena]|uniref:amino acid adenylation domain-containing protein n=1 Tax=unclassified Anabaena TaxID=2619674 RepID=UPI00082EC7E8|nr:MULTISPECIES: amino acid adenylation domain-containing protein [unclassified Anabaena]